MARRIQGIPRLLRKLEKLKTETAPVIKPIMEIIAERICQDMRALVPVDQGDLKKSIGWTWSKAPAGSLNVKVATGGMVLTIYAGNAKAYYARWIEFGTRSSTKGERVVNASGRERKAGRSHPGTRAQPFFYPAFRANKKMYLRELRKAINQAIKQAIS